MLRVVTLILSLLMVSIPALSTFAQTVLTDVWKDKEPHAPMTKIAVFWILQVPQNRLLAENEFVRQLKERGIKAMPMYVVIPPDKFVEKDAALTKLRDLGMDAVLSLRLTDRQTAQMQIPGTGPNDPLRLSGYYQYVYDAPTLGTSGPAYVETNLFDVKSDRRIWTARSVSKIDAVNREVVTDFIRLMIDRLASDGMIP